MNPINKNFFIKNKIIVGLALAIIVILFFLLTFLDLDFKKINEDIKSLDSIEINDKSRFGNNSEINFSDKENVLNEKQNIQEEKKDFKQSQKNNTKDKKVKNNLTLKEDDKKNSKPINQSLESQNSALDTVKILHDGLIKISLNKLDSIKTIKFINETYDINKMLSMIVGNEWKNIELNKKKELIIVFEEYIAKNYLKRFSKINEIEFINKEEKKIGNGVVLIKTTLVIKKNDKVNIDYLLSVKNDRWKIFDILLDGSISEIATKKSEFRRFIKDRNIDTLINALEEINYKLLD